MRLLVMSHLAAALAAVPAVGAHAEDGGAREPVDGPVLTAISENDFYAQSGDRNYTAGQKGVYLSGPLGQGSFAAGISRALFGDEGDRDVRQSFAIGQSIFTADDITVAEPLPDQRPYAGWLYAEYSVLSQNYRGADVVTMQAGVVGSSAQGEAVQNLWHDLIAGPRAQGWDNQIDDEVAINVSYDHMWRPRRIFGGDRFAADWSPSAGADFGNVRIDAHAGMTFRIGRGLKNDYGPPRIAPALGGVAYVAPRSRFGWHLFAGMEGRAVVHDIFLDGSLFRRGDPSVPSRVFVGDFQGGIVLQFRKTQFTYTYVHRTREFDGQFDPQKFGSLSLSRRF
ncbi:MAG: lipid A deacylase LpxR family protein [Parvularculaceae bacterium]